MQNKLMNSSELDSQMKIKKCGNRISLNQYIMMNLRAKQMILNTLTERLSIMIAAMMYLINIQMNMHMEMKWKEMRGVIIMMVTYLFREIKLYLEKDINLL